MVKTIDKCLTRIIDEKIKKTNDQYQRCKSEY
jgi:hypothetical protein